VLTALKLSPHGVGLPDLRYAAEAVDEAAAIHSFWLNDHLLAPFDPAQPVWEAWSLLAAMSAWTSRVRLGAMVSPIALRPAPLLAKMAVTVDHLCGGRLELALGFGSSVREHRWAGLRAPRKQPEAMIEYCRIVRAVWTGEPVDDDPSTAPRALQSNLPLWIGGSSRAALEAAATLGARWNLQSLGDDQAERLINLLGSMRPQQRQPIGLSTSAQTVFKDERTLERDVARASRLGLDLLVVSIMHEEPRVHLKSALEVIRRIS
jgi:alkanesulfonate monooxygenase SsuD/methylene tetrahydromethanopterin reductase-like flavin-dependent oxidoreductase (luciferase family)